jgi:hypothetical protein
MNNPSRSDHYLMRIACEIVRGQVKEPNKVHLDQMKIEFVPKKVLTPEEIIEEQKRQAAISQSMWFGVLGLDENGRPRRGNPETPSSPSG